MCVARYRVNDGFPGCSKDTDDNVAKFKCSNLLDFEGGDASRYIPRAWFGNSLLDCKPGTEEVVILRNYSSDKFMCLDKSRCLLKKV